MKTRPLRLTDLGPTAIIAKLSELHVGRGSDRESQITFADKELLINIVENSGHNFTDAHGTLRQCGNYHVIV